MSKQGSIPKQTNARAADSAEGKNINTNKRSLLTKQSSDVSISGMSDRSVSRSSGSTLDRISVLKNSLNEHHDIMIKQLLTSKETADKRNQIESAFRFCKEAFLEVANTLTCLLNENFVDKTDLIKNTVREIFDDIKVQGTSITQDNTTKDLNTYAAVAARAVSKIHTSQGSSFEVPAASTSFTIVPIKDGVARYASSQDTHEAVCKVLRPSECALKIKRITNTRDNGIKIEAVSPDIEKIKTHPHLAEAGLKVVEKLKMNPRLIVYGVPSEMSSEEIRKELIAQNLDNDNDVHLKVVYIYKPKANKNYTSCVIEVSPGVRMRLLKNEHIYLRFSACKSADYIRVLQCYKCLSFGHIAKDCKDMPVCGHCTESHETKDCNNKQKSPLCCNCIRTAKKSTCESGHSALDAKKCPIIGNKIKDLISNINYGLSHC